MCHYRILPSLFNALEQSEMGVIPFESICPTLLFGSTCNLSIGVTDDEKVLIGLERRRQVGNGLVGEKDK